MKINEYIEKITEQIKYKPIRNEIAKEINNHIEESKETYIAEGIDENEAEEKAIEQMGNAKEIGKRLNKIHKPKLDWKLLLMICLTLGFGILVAFIRGWTCLSRTGYGKSLLISKYFWGLFIGILISVPIYFLDYKKMLKFSNIFYIIATICCMIVASYLGVRIAGRIYISIFGLAIPPANLAMPFYLIAFIGFLQNIEKGKVVKIEIQERKFEINMGVIKIIFLSVISLILFVLLNSNTLAIILGIVYIILATEKIKNLSNNKKKYLILLWGIPILLSILFIILFPYKTDYRWERVLNSFNPERDPAGGGWIGIQQQLIIDSANLIGEADNMAVTKELFDEGTNYAFISILAHFGWIPSIVMVVVIIMLNVKLIINAISIKDIYGKMLIKGVASIFILESLFNILMNLNMGVQANFSLPLVSYGRLDLIINLCLLSIVMSVYRRKDILVECKENL